MPEVFDEMGLIKITCLIGGFGQRGIRGEVLDQPPEPDDRGILLGGRADKPPKPLFERVLAQVKGGGQLVDADDPIVLADQPDRIADEGVLFCIYEVVEQKRFYLSHASGIGAGFRKLFQQPIEVPAEKEVRRGNRLVEVFVRGHPGEAGDAAFFENDEEVGGLGCVGELPHRPAETGDDDIRQGLLRSHYQTAVSQGHHQGSVGDDHTIGGFVRFDKDELPDKRLQGDGRVESLQAHGHLIQSKIIILPLFYYTSKPLLCSQNTGMEAQEIQALRAATAGTTERTHFNNAGTSFPPDIVVDTVTAYLRKEAVTGGYELEAACQQQLQNVYVSIAKLINASVEEVALVENASTGWHLAFNGIDFKPGDEVITSEMEYVSNLIGFLNLKKNRGIDIKVVPNDAGGNFPLAALEAAISPATRLIAITHIPSTAGNVLPVAAIGAIARRHGILYLVDACQAAGQTPIDVKEIQCDLLSATGRKYLRGPRGTGFLYVRKEIRDQLRVLFMDDHSTATVTETDFELRPDARRFELFEKSRALSLGLGKAIDYALELGVDRIWERIQFLSRLTRQRLEEIPGVTVHDRGDTLCGIVTFSVAGKDSAQVKKELAERKINVSIGRAGSTLLYMNKKHLVSVVRASVHYYNTEEEIDLLCVALRGK